MDDIVHKNDFRSDIPKVAAIMEHLMMLMGISLLVLGCHVSIVVSLFNDGGPNSFLQ
jgi:hypothetical protein